MKKITVADMLSDMTKRRIVSASLRRSVRVGDDAERALVIAAWYRADELAVGVLCLARSREPLSEPIGVLARSLWEGAVRTQYAAADPSKRLRQMRNHAIFEEKKILNGEWAKGASRKINPQYFEIQKKALAEHSAAPLPSLWNMANSQGVAGQYDMIYRLESAGAHWGLTAVADHARLHRSGHFVVSRRGRNRLPQVLALAVTTYSVIVYQCARMAGVSTERLDQLRTPLSLMIGPKG